MSLLIGFLLNPLVILLLVIGAVVYLRRARPGERSGERFLRGLWLTLLVLSTAGFGLCGGFGVVAGLVSVTEGGESGAYGAMFLAVGGVGVAIAALTGWLLRRALRADRQLSAAPEPDDVDLSPFSPAAPPPATPPSPRDNGQDGPS
ncbi:hypothetical protein [Ideonella alba]|uniref:Transmembrane protein n=1 Tax=Ideonella alba TaxID=2824118 RepID=A0A940Y5G1_9BURK|nr:hypothetical protein [Ideonella alba]MBQ0929061.1 hypothetical protein [Ideonella alba]